jgi:N-acetylneuraminic acid mutarotase
MRRTVVRDFCFAPFLCGLMCGLLATSARGADPATAADVPYAQTVWGDLPYGITSFGAARIDDTVYAYGGHTGTAHAYWDESQSNELLALDLTQEKTEWKVVATGKRLQGLAMVAHGKKLICVGGFHARNKKGAPHDLHSEAVVDVYDTVSGNWSTLPPLPLGRSSHDAALIGDQLYVVGGWCMAGADNTTWHTSALVMDLSAAEPTWQEIAAPQFQRRALAAVGFQDKLFVIGGMNQDGGPTRDVAIYDPLTQQWSEGPAIQGEDGMTGFGAAGWTCNDRLVVTTIRGQVQVLSQDATHWELREPTENARFFHRLVPLAPGQLLSIGGASMESGKFLEPEIIRFEG